MEIDVGYVLMSLLWGSFGMAYLVYGKRRGHIPAIICGLLLLGFPYFVTNFTALILVGLLLVAGPWILTRFF